MHYEARLEMIEAIDETFRTDNTVLLLKVEVTVAHVGLEISWVEHRVADRKFTRLYPERGTLAVQLCHFSGNADIKNIMLW